MRKNLSLLRPRVCTQVLKNKCREKVTFLDIPEDVDLKSLKRDVKLGAKQFSELEALIQKENEPQYILIYTDNQEQGYMAVTYLEAGFNRKHNREKESYIWEETEGESKKDVDLQEVWLEDDFQVPIIEESCLKRWLRNDLGDIYSTSGWSMMGARNNICENPYWTTCTEGPVCITIDDWNNFLGFSNGELRDEVLLEGLNYFEKNDKVYILIIEQDENYIGTEGEGNKGKWFYLALNFSADQVRVSLGKDKGVSYFKEVFRGIFATEQVSVAKGFCYQRMAHLLAFMRERNKCETAENIIKYAIKDWSSPQMHPITNKDFAFMDRYCKVSGEKLEVLKTMKKQTAREKLIQDLIGMEEVKKEVLQVVDVMKYNRLRIEMGIGNSSYHNVHLMLGAPGTAKTTVANLMGQIMMEEGMLPDNRFVCVNGAELKGMYVGHSAPKTKQIFESYDIIVIDEAYSLVQDGAESDSFSKEAIAQLIIELEEHSMDKLVIFAGYGGRKVSERNNKMKSFLDANPGLRSRITSTIYFDSYSPKEMVQIFFHLAERQHYILDEEAREGVFCHFAERIKDDNFGNGREARRLLETSVSCAASRVLSQNKKNYTKIELQKILREDVERAIQQMEYAQEVQNGGGGRKKMGFYM